MTESKSELLNRKKRILWRARHRGMKEMDLMLGNYATQKLEKMDQTQLDEFETILEVSDSFLLDWLTDKEDTPTEFQTAMFAEIKAQSFVSNDYKKH